MRFDRTYEELKPGMCSNCMAFPPSSFDRTYEELKLIGWVKTGRLNGRFDRTYEELKLASRDHRPEGLGFVLIIPMRN